MRQAASSLSYLLSEVFNGLAVFGLVYVIVEDVTIWTVIKWLGL